MSQVKQLEFIIKDSNEQLHLNLRVVEKNANYLIHRALITQNQNRHQFSANTKTRSEVRGGGRKPWKQKGTGRARAGSNRSPLWNGGGVIFGPKPKKIKKKLNRKEFRLSLETLLYNRKNQILIFNDFNLKTTKTKKFINELDKLGLKQKISTLLIVSEKTYEIMLASRNISYLKVKTIKQLTLSDIINARQIAFEKSALLAFNKD